MLSKENYKEELKGINVVEVSGESCANCLSLMPVLTRVMSKRNDSKLLHIEATESTRWFMDLYDVRNVPSILIIKDSKLIDKCYGFQPEEIHEVWIDMKIKKL